MSGQTDGTDDEPLVRPYILTGGHPVGPSSLDMASLVVARRKRARDADLEPEQLELLALCREPQSIAELSARSRMPIPVIKFLVEDLLSRGYAECRAPGARSEDATLLNSVLAGLRRL